MKTFDDIYNSLKSNFEPQSRSLLELKIILTKVYSVLKNDKYAEYAPFEISGSVIDTDRTTIERLISELQEIKFEDNGIYIVKSEGIERTIADIKTLEIQAINPVLDDNISLMFDFSRLKAHLLYLINTTREGLIFSKQKIILDNLVKLKSKDEKLNYLNSLLIKLKQNEKLWDKVQFESLNQFVELELLKWEKHIAKNEDIKKFSSAQELHEFISNLIKERLEHNIRYSEGYRSFWRDELCHKEQKKENEIHPYIKSILKPYCDDRNIKITREEAIANGRVDMTFTYLNFNICLEVKKAHHQDVTNAINTQLTDYMIGAESEYGIYLVLWYKSSDGFNMPKKYQNIDKLISDIKVQSDIFKYKIMGIDCSKPISPSNK